MSLRSAQDSSCFALFNYNILNYLLIIMETFYFILNKRHTRTKCKHDDAVTTHTEDV